MILYFGNKLKKSKGIQSMLETLEPFLSELSPIKTYSHLKNPIFKIMHSCTGLLANRKKTTIVLLDLFSSNYKYYAWILCFLCKALDKKYILILRGGNLPQAYQKQPQLFGSILKNAERIIAPSGYLFDAFKPLYSKIELIPNCIEGELYTYQPKRPCHNPNLLYIRSYGKVYNPSLCIEALKLLIPTFPNIQLTMIGHDIDGSMSDIKHLVQKYQLHNNVSILAAMDKKEWIKQSESADIMVSTPFIDNTPISLIEGMLLGIPIISTNVGGIPYLLEHKINGILIESNNAKQLANAVIEVCTESDLRKSIIEQAHVKALTFTCQNIKPLWQNVLLPYIA